MYTGSLSLSSRLDLKLKVVSIGIIKNKRTEGQSPHRYKGEDLTDIHSSRDGNPTSKSNLHKGTKRVHL